MRPRARRTSSCAGRGLGRNPEEGGSNRPWFQDGYRLRGLVEDERAMKDLRGNHDVASGGLTPVADADAVQDMGRLEVDPGLDTDVEFLRAGPLHRTPALEARDKKQDDRPQADCASPGSDKELPSPLGIRGWP